MSRGRVGSGSSCAGETIRDNVGRERLMTDADLSGEDRRRFVGAWAGSTAVSVAVSLL
jgi:hypothetical protein